MDTATLVGRVSDPFGKLIVGARVELIDIDRHTKIHVLTNRSGIYLFPDSRPGHYRVTVSAPGYTTATISRLVIFVQDDIQQNFRMTPGSPLESVTIHENGTPVEMTGAVGTVVEPDLVNQLPLNGRSFQTLFQLTPGVVIAPTTFSSQGQFSVDGQRTDSNYFIVDGAGANAGIAAGVFPGQSAAGTLPALTAFGGTNSLVSTEDVQEFAVLTSSYSAEFGRLPGAQVSIVTRSGTDEVHGRVFDYLRNEAFDANDWFANRDHLKRAALRQNDYGAVVGGPLLRDKTFFFISYEGLRLRQPTSSESDVPSVEARSSAPLSLQPFLRAYPLPTGPDEGNDMASASYAFSNPASLDTGSVRIDRIQESLSSFVRYDNSASLHEERGAGSSSLSVLSDTEFRLQTLTAGLTFRFSSSVVNDLRFNWSQSAASGTYELDTFGGAVPFPATAVFPLAIDTHQALFQFVSAPSAQQPELSLGRNIANTQRQINIVNSTSMQVGSNVLKVGVDLRTMFPNIAPPSYEQQVVSSSLDTAVAGNFLFAVIGTSAAVHSRFSSYSVYAEDSWRPPRRVSTDFGLRWDYDPAPVGKGSNGLLPVSVLSNASLSAFSLAPQGTPLYRVRIANFAPRVGAAFQIRNSPETETVIRAGAGLFYDLGYDPAGNALTGGVFPFFAQKFVPAPQFPLTAVDAAAPVSSFNGPFGPVVGFAHAFKMPYTWQWNVSLQQSCGSGQVLNLSYVGAIGRNLLRTEQYFGGQGGVPLIFSDLLLTTNAGFSNYQSFQVKFQRRVSETAHVIALYALSHSLDNVSVDSAFDGIPSRFVDPNRDYASSDFDIRHAASVAIDYRLPFQSTSSWLVPILSKWSVDSILMLRSAPPVNVVVSRDMEFGPYDVRPDVIEGQPRYLDDPSAPGGRKINPASVAIPIEPRQGTLGRNSFRGFPLAELDLSIRRAFSINERLGVQARVEAFNLFNHPNFAPPDGTLGTVDSTGGVFLNKGFGLSKSTFGQGLQGGSSGNAGSGFSPLYQIGSKRSLQLALKIEF
jgi:hypothetical protein